MVSGARLLLMTTASTLTWASFKQDLHYKIPIRSHYCTGLPTKRDLLYKGGVCCNYEQFRRGIMCNLDANVMRRHGLDNRNNAKKFVDFWNFHPPSLVALCSCGGPTRRTVRLGGNKHLISFPWLQPTVDIGVAHWMWLTKIVPISKTKKTINDAKDLTKGTYKRIDERK